ncbi:MAG: hypothetical protein APF84_06095 [Gracilibacter sp. BRH_c7a]|nr:MAG: hypothetical protein APF84_06095 [Gracilibacter sp. BRH_c7a]
MKLRNIRTELVKILHLEDTPNAIALSVAIGVFWNFIPTIGLGVFVSILFAKLLKVRVVIAATANLATGFFIPFFYTLNLITGRILTGFTVNLDEIGGTLGNSIEQSVTGIDEVIVNPKLYFLYDMFHSLSIDFVIGSITNAFLAACMIYISLWLVLKNRKKYKKLTNNINDDTK